MLEMIAEKLGASQGWMEDLRQRGQMVKLYRDYYDGQHRMKVTSEMRKMMQITDNLTDRYNANYCEMVVDSMADRLEVTTIEDGGDSDEAQAWVDTLRDVNRFDALQIEVRTACLRDGETFVLTEFDSEAGTARWFQEDAWDGTVGTFVMYDRKGQKIEAAVKVWWEGDARYANIYYQNRVEKYAWDEGAPAEGNNPAREPQLVSRSEPIETEGLGVPVVHFPNKNKRNKPGRSEISNVIPLQDSLNRTLISMVMTAELTGFRILFANGFKPGAAITPGMIIYAGVFDANSNPMVAETADEARAIAALNDSYKLDSIEPGDLTPLIAQAEFLIHQIGTVSSTPVPSQMGGDSSSGEALKQREVRLIGKVSRAQVQMGNAWEDCVRVAAAMQVQYGNTQPPELGHLSTQWKTAELRNDADILLAAKQLQAWGFERAALRTLAQSSLADFTEEEIDRMMEEKAADAGAALAAVSANLPDFAGVNFG